jgi:hypothetical protein
MTNEGTLVSLNESQGETPSPEKKKKYKPRPNWSYWLKCDRLTLRAAIALSFNISPDEVELALLRNESLQGPFSKRLTPAYYHTLANGRITVVQHGQNEDGSDTVVDAKSLVAFAVSMKWPRLTPEFLALGGGQPEAAHQESSPNKSHEKAVISISGTRKIIKLLVELAIKMEAKGQPPLDIDNVPGPKEDLYIVAHYLYKDLDMEKSTFYRYLKGLCKFKSGPPSKDTLLRQLYSEHF